MLWMLVFLVLVGAVLILGPLVVGGQGAKGAIG